MNPRYVTRDSEQAFAPPYRQDGCALYAFAMPAARARLQAVVDRFLTAPSGGRLQPRVAADHLLLYFCDFAASQSHDPEDAGRGWLGERECGLWIPLRIEGSASPAFFTHAMFVDSGPAMCSGREVLGFPKEIGLLHVPRDPARAQSLTLDALTLGATGTLYLDGQQTWKANSTESKNRDLMYQKLSGSGSQAQSTEYNQFNAEVIHTNAPRISAQIGA